MAPTTMEDNQTATMAPPPYIITVDLFSRPSHCTVTDNQNKTQSQSKSNSVQAMASYLFLQVCEEFVGVNGR